MKKLLIINCVVSIVLANAVPVPYLDLTELTQTADLIVVGRINKIEDRGDTTLESTGEHIPARLMVGEMQVDRTLKGSMEKTSPLTFEFSLPISNRGFASVVAGSYRILFLKRKKEGFTFVSPYYPSVVAVPAVPVSPGDPIARVVDQLGGVLKAPSSVEDKSQAIFALSSLQNADATLALKRVLKEDNALLRASAIAALLQRNDVSVLPAAAEILASRNPDIPKYQVDNISYAIMHGVKDETAVSTLATLLKLPDVVSRRAAAFALRNTGSSSATSALASALYDSDGEVRYYAVVGLGEITGQTDWRPLEEDFKANETKYLSYWRQWSRENLTASP